MTAAENDVGQIERCRGALLTVELRLGELAPQVSFDGPLREPLLELKSKVAFLQEALATVARNVAERDHAYGPAGDPMRDPQFRAAYDLEVDRLCAAARAEALTWPENARQSQ